MSDSTKRKILTIAAYSLVGVVIIALSIWGAAESERADEYREATEAMYRRAFYDLADELGTLEHSLAKLTVSGSRTRYVKLLGDIRRSSGAAVALMSQIPSSHVDTAELSSFIVRVGDYARSLSDRLLSGEMPAERDYEQLEALHGRCAQLTEATRAMISQERIPVEVMTVDAYFTASDAASAPFTNADTTDKQGAEDDEDREDFPTLIYDGPYSESAEKAEPRGLSGDEVSSERAAELAAEFAPDGTSLDFDGESAGDIPAYDFSGTTPDGGFCELSITKQGGDLLWFLSSASGSGSGVPSDEEVDALKAAAIEFLSGIGYENMAATYAQYYGGAAVINFAATQDGVILYSDLVKVWVDLETHEVIGADARNYLYSHTRRDLPTPTLNEDDARALVSSNLEIQSIELALIPLTPETERLCYEFKGKRGDDSYIVYINAETGDEEEIFLIINSEEGTMVV